MGDSIARLGVVAVRERPIPPSLRTGIGVWTSMMRTRLIKQPTDCCYLCDREYKFSLLELDHVVPVAADLLRALDATNLRPVCPRCHKNKSAAEQPSREGMTRRCVRWERITQDMLRLRDEMTYDIQVDGPHHNYVANGLVVHNSYNEMSSRYAPLPSLDYIPTIERLMMNGGLNKQAGTAVGSDALTHDRALAFRDNLRYLYTDAQDGYERALKDGVPKELARLMLPVGRYSQMRASTCLRNWLGFVTLRADPKAQWEIQQYAHAVGQILQDRFPRTFGLYLAQQGW